MTGEPRDGQTEPTTAEQWRPAIPLVRLFAGRWTLALLAGLLERGRRYQDLHDALDGISYKVLTETLRRAERDGLVARHLDGERIETATLYELTDLGRSLDVPLAAMAEWAECNWQVVEAARSRWDRLRRASGEETFVLAHGGVRSHLEVRLLSLKCRFAWWYRWKS